MTASETSGFGCLAVPVFCQYVSTYFSIFLLLLGLGSITLLDFLNRRHWIVRGSHGTPDNDEVRIPGPAASLLVVLRQPTIRAHAGAHFYNRCLSDKRQILASAYDSRCAGGSGYLG